jgi:hypothetical protein
MNTAGSLPIEFFFSPPTYFIHIPTSFRRKEGRKKHIVVMFVFSIIA